MLKFFKHLAFCCFLLFPATVFAAPNLTSIAAINVTSDTASNAKNMALAEARRQIITEVLSRYSEQSALRELMQNTDNSKLTNLVLSTSIDGERLSTTTYSANIKMTLDAVAARQWLDENNVKNWLNVDDTTSDKSTIVVDIPGGLRDWIELKQILQNEKLSIDTKRISGAQVTAGISATNRSAFVAAVRAAGWKYSNADGFLRIWK